MTSAALAGRSALITGAASGIGRASVLLFASEGARLMLLDRDPAVEEVAETVRSQGGEASALTGDAGDEQFVADAVKRTVDAYGSIDICFANAGISGGLVHLLDQDAAYWSEVLRINLIGAFLAVKYAGAAMKEAGGGAIICTASVAGLRSGAGGSAYSASKAGVISLVQTAANQFRGAGIRVNAVCPGLIETGMTQPLFDAARDRGTEDKIGQLNPLQRPGQAEEIARVALFLASDASSYVNGQAIAVDGGLSSSHPIASVRKLA